MVNSVATSRAANLRFPWMFGRAYDLFFFFSSFLFGFAFYLLTTTSLAASSVIFAALIPTAFGAGPFHQGPTWFAFFDKKNREYYGSTPKKRVIFFMAPPLIMLFSVLGMIFCKPLLLAIWVLWSIQHLIQQNVGILLLYHNHNQGEAVVERQVEVRSQQAAGIFFTALFVRRIILEGKNFPLFDAVIVALGLWAAWMCVNYLLRLRQKINNGEALNVPALGFWLLSVLSLCPMALLGKDFAVAFLAPVTWHWFQYIGLNYKLVKNKYGGERATDLLIGKPLLSFFAICLFLMTLNLALSVGSLSTPDTAVLAKNLFYGLAIGLVNCHYFLDAFIWRFREPYQRQAILPYLVVRNRVPQNS